MTGSGGVLSRNPNICASCSSLADGMDEPSIASLEVGSEEEVPMLEVEPTPERHAPHGVEPKPAEAPCPQGS